LAAARAAGRRAWAVGCGTCRRLGRALARVRAVAPRAWRGSRPGGVREARRVPGAAELERAGLGLLARGREARGGEKREKREGGVAAAAARGRERLGQGRQLGP
jgi:hypothetical protein